MAAKFGAILAQRRHEMGLSLQQVSNIIKIRPQIIEFFENGDFASMPPRGYAQGMIVSYARFLNLNSQEIVNLYFDELLDYERSSGSQAGSYQEEANMASPRSAQQAGRFMMVEGGRYTGRTPQAGYVTETATGSEIQGTRNRVRNAAMPTDSAVPAMQGRPQDARAGYGDGTRFNRRSRIGHELRVQSALDAQNAGMDATGSLNATGNLNLGDQDYFINSAYGEPTGRTSQFGTADEQTTASMGAAAGYSSGQAQRAPRSSASRGTSRNRNSSRNASQRARTGRNNGRAGTSSSQRYGNQSSRNRALNNAQGRRSTSGSYGAAQSGGILGFLFSDIRYLAAAAGGLLLAIVLIVFLLTGGCTSKKVESNSNATVTAAQGSSSNKSSKKASTTATATAEQAGSSATNAAATDENADNADDAENTDANAEATEPVVMKVSVADGKTAWVEVKVDGKSVYAGQTTGPWEQEYNPSISIDITTSKPSYVTVYKNGEKQKYDTKTSGVAKLSVNIPQPETTDEEGSGTSEDGASAQSDDGSSDEPAADQGYYDENGNWVASTNGYYDAEGDWISYDG